MFFRLLKPLYSKGEDGDTPNIVAFSTMVLPQHLIISRVTLKTNLAPKMQYQEVCFPILLEDASFVFWLGRERFNKKTNRYFQK